jgi:hypothetical protein
LWANNIETGDINLTQSDVINMIKAMPDDEYHKSDKCELMNKLRDLSDDQKTFVARLRALAKYIRDGNTRLS